MIVKYNGKNVEYNDIKWKEAKPGDRLTHAGWTLIKTEDIWIPEEQQAILNEKEKI